VFELKNESMIQAKKLLEIEQKAVGDILEYLLY